MLKDEKLYKPIELASRLRVSHRTVLWWLQSGRLKGLKVGGTWRIRENDLDAFLYKSDQKGRR